MRLRAAVHMRRGQAILLPYWFHTAEKAPPFWTGPLQEADLIGGACVIVMHPARAYPKALQDAGKKCRDMRQV